jgi:hypothetical protein
MDTWRTCPCMRHGLMKLIHTWDTKFGHPFEVTLLWRLLWHIQRVNSHARIRPWAHDIYKTLVPIVCSADPKGSATSSQVIRGYISVMATLKVTYFCNQKNNVLLKIILELLYLALCLFCIHLECLIMKISVPTMRTEFISVTVKSCNALLHMLLMCVLN